jgi:translation elongation factor EF-G
VAPPSKTRASNTCSTPSSITFPARSTSRRHRQDPDNERKDRGDNLRPRQVRLPRLQTLGGQVVGKLVFFRVYSGKVKKGDTIYNPRTRRTERVGRLIQIQANQHTDIDACYAGDIAAMVGIKDVTHR